MWQTAFGETRQFDGLRLVFKLNNTAGTSDAVGFLNLSILLVDDDALLPINLAATTVSVIVTAMLDLTQRGSLLILRSPTNLMGGDGDGIHDDRQSHLLLTLSIHSAESANQESEDSPFFSYVADDDHDSRLI